MTALLADVNRYRKSLIAVVLYGFDLPAPDGDTLPETIRYIGFAGAGAIFFGIIQNVPRNFLKHRERIGKTRGRAGIIVHGNFKGGGPYIDWLANSTASSSSSHAAYTLA